MLVLHVSDVDVRKSMHVFPGGLTLALASGLDGRKVIFEPFKGWAGSQEREEVKGAAWAGLGFSYSQGVFCLVDKEVHLVELALGDGSIGHQQADPYREREVSREGLEGVWGLRIGDGGAGPQLGARRERHLLSSR